MRKKNIWKKAMGVLLTSAMLFTAVPVSADGFEREEEAAGFETEGSGEEESENRAEAAGEVQGVFEEEAETPEQTEETPLQETEQEVAAEEEAGLLTASGTSGTTKWTLNASGQLVISGKGKFSYVSSLDKYGESVTSIVIEEGVTDIGDGAFQKLSMIETISLPDSLQTIGKNAFTGGQGPSKVHIPKGVKRIGEDAFRDCIGLETLTFDDGVKNLIIEAGAFYSIGITELHIPAGVSELGDFAFRYCFSLKEVTIEPGLKKMGTCAFEAAMALTRVEIPGTIQEIGDYAFFACENLEEITLGEGLTIIGLETFSGGLPYEMETVFKELVVHLPSTLNKIEACAFNASWKLKEIRIPGFVETIGYRAFANAVNLTNIYFEGDCPEISEMAFEDVTATAYYPADMPGWTSDKLKGYGGTITWVPYAPQLRTPALVSAENTSSGIKVSWNPVSGAAGYTVLRKAEGGSWASIGRTTNTFYNNGTGEAGTAYFYTVRAYRGSYDTAKENPEDVAYWSEYDTDGIKAVRLTPGKISSVSNAASSINIKWGKVTGAKGYYVYRKTGTGSYKMIATVGASALSYSDKDIKNGTAYTYAVRPYSGTSRGTYTGVKTYRLSRSLISSAKKSGSGKIAVKWGKNVRVTGYQISYTTGGTTKYKTVSGSGNVSATLTGLKAGKSYTIKVRGYKTVSGQKYYAGWSTAKTVKA